MQGRQPAKGKRQTADSSDDDAPAAKKPKGGGGRGAGRKKAAPALGGVQTDLHGKRITEKKQMNLADMIGAQRSPAAAAAPKKPAAAVGFASGEVLGEAWHALIGYEKQDAKGKSVPFTPEEVAIVLKANPTFVQRVLASDESYFIGPAKELLLEMAKQPAPGAPGTPGARRPRGEDTDGAGDGGEDGEGADQPPTPTPARLPPAGPWRARGHAH